ncbi:MAG: heat-inducible transcriptional repressor HrcA [Clostridia bacterium]|nr:heat-inducible transcriptional repressor HrcA [Clostridia bacterium]
MDLSERKRKILQAIIDEYIGTAEPVGSRAISKKESLGLSSATIRNEMADLEEMGYLIQPHTSSGRVPSDEGYRFYVNSLMQQYQLGVEAINRLREMMENRVTQLEKIIKQAGALTSSLTEYTTFVTTPGRISKIKKLDLVPVGYHMVMLIVVTITVSSRVISADVTEKECAELAKILNKHLVNLSAEEISFKCIEEIQREIESTMELPAQVLINILNFVYETISAMNDSDIYINNVNSILKYPEYSDLSKARRLFDFLEDKEAVKLLAGGDDENGINAKIGKENGLDILDDCSLVTVNYTLGDRRAGKLGVIGPKRMNYAKVFASLDIISKEIDKILKDYL